MSWLPGDRTPDGYAADLVAWLDAVAWARRYTDVYRPPGRAGYYMLAREQSDPLRADALRALGDACAPVAPQAAQFAAVRPDYVRKPLRPMTGGRKDEDAVMAALGPNYQKEMLHA